jgi:hypothetical protein
MHLKRTFALAVALAAASTSAACDADDTATTTTTPSAVVATTTVAVTTTTAPATTAPEPSSTTSTVATTAPPPPTTSVDDLKAQIAADYVASQQRLAELEAAPTLDNLEARLATIAAPGSAYYEQLLAYVQELVQLGDVVIPSDPPVNMVVVESVDLEGTAPFVAATLTVCDANNLKRVTPPEHSPVGQEIYVDGGVLAARRFRAHVVSTPDGWLREDSGDTTLNYYEGQTTCDAP